MQNAFIQVAIGLIPAALLFTVLGFAAKKHRLRNFTVGAVFLVAAAVIAVPHLSELSKDSVKTSADENLRLVYAVAEEGSFDVADSLLQNQADSYIPEHSLMRARLAMLRGEYKTAKMLYGKVSGSFDISEELDAATAVCEAESAYYGALSNDDAASAGTVMREKADEAHEIIEDAIKAAVGENGEVAEKLASSIVYAENAHSQLLDSGSVDTDDVEKKLRRLNTVLEENPQYLSVPSVRLARLKLQLLCEDYKSIAESADGSSDHNELLIISELYLNGYVKQSNFTGDFSKSSSAAYQAVYDRLSDNVDELFDDRTERKAAEARLDAMKADIKNPALGKLREALSEYAEGEYAADASKAYLQIAKIEYSRGNDAISAEYIDRSIDTVGDCDDDNYTVPMYELAGIIADKDNPERLKNAATYVDEVLDNNMTVKMNITPANQGSDDDGENLAEDFAGKMQTYVSQKRMAVNIVGVDTSRFATDGTVKATVNISDNLYTTTQALESAMTVRDCGVNISGITVEKIECSGSNILLCVDTSGSMYGDKIVNLQNAVSLFAAKKSEKENLALVTFNGDVQEDLPFGISAEQLTDAADAIYADGGTAVYSSIIHSIGKFTNDPGTVNTIIVMTDGRDGYYASQDEIEQYIGIPCKANNITVYTIGFGSDADGDYLNAIAAATGGTYLYASDPTADSQMNQLDAFFSGLRAQILNQYSVTFKAEDTLSYTRELKLSLGGSTNSDTVTYYLGGSDGTVTEPDDLADSPVFMDGKTVYGFVPRMILKNGKTQKTVLSGEGFAADDKITVLLKGKATGLELELGAEYVDGNSVSVTVPAGIGSDTYDVYVQINGNKAVLPNGLLVYKQGSRKTTVFGDYKFTSYTKKTSGGSITLSGDVTMNDWLHFNGDITLSGNLKSESISLCDTDGSYVNYDKATSIGLANCLANSYSYVGVSAMGEITLFNDKTPNDSGVVINEENFFLEDLSFGNMIVASQIDYTLLPNRFTFEADSLLADLPFADKVFKNKFDLFSYDFTFGGSFCSKNIGIKIDLDLSAGDTVSSTFSTMNFGNTPMYVAPKDTEIHIDTLENDYEFLLKVTPAFFSSTKVDSIGLSLKWDGPDDDDDSDTRSNGLVPTEIKLYADFDIPCTFAGVPVTFSDFEIGIENIDTSKSPFFWTLIGACDISACKISSLPALSGLKKWIGDVSVASLDDTRLSLCLGEAYVKAETKLKLLEGLDLGNATVELGKFKYTNKLLGLYDASAAGLRADLKVGPDWTFGNSHLKLQLRGELNIHNKFLGLQGTGSCDATLKLWIVSIAKHMNCEIAIGIRMLSSGSPAFVISTNPQFPKGAITFPKNVADKW